MRSSFQSRYLRVVAAAVAFTAFAACDVEQTQPAQVPDVDVDVSAEPGRWPQYDVDWADVQIGTREQEVTVPVVRVVEETRQIRVPYIDINPPGSRGQEERAITMELDVPHSGFRLEIAEVRAAGDDLWVIGRLTQSDSAGAQAITRVSDHVVVNAPDDLDVRKVVVGQRPQGSYNQQYRFVESTAALEQMIPQGARTLYRR